MNDKRLDISLRGLGLMTPDTLDCAEGGQHAVLEPELEVAFADAFSAGSAHVKCRKCGAQIELRPLRE